MENTFLAEERRALSNREMASVLFNIASLLRAEGHPNRFRIEAYERGARALMGLRRQAAEILLEEKAVPFRSWQHIGTKLQRKIREMTAGKLAQYEELVAGLSAPYAPLLTVPFVGPKTAERVHRFTGITKPEELYRAAREGRLRHVPGFGEQRTAYLAGRSSADGEQLSLFEN